MLDLALKQRQNQRHADECAAKRNERRENLRNFEPFHAAVPSESNRRGAENQAHVPERGPCHGKSRADQRSAQQTGKQPQRHGKSGHGGPAVGHRVQVQRSDAPERQLGLFHQPIRKVHFQRRNQAGDGADDQPRHGAEHERQKGSAR